MSMGVLGWNMATCRRCGGSYGVEELVRHEHERLLVVHCPDCGGLLGRYRRHGEHAPRS
jgi:uncharacterized Zn finger protein